jgi:hypothetical protein
MARKFTKLLLVALCLDVAAAASKASKGSCEGDAYDFWTTNVKAGHRAFYVDAHETHVGLTCAAKGNSSSDAILDPVVRSHMSLAIFEQDSRMPCALMGGEGWPNFKRKVVRRVNQTTTAACDSLGAPTDCKYPKQDELGQKSYGGTSFKISMVNGMHSTESFSGSGLSNAPVEGTGKPNAINNKISVAPVFGSKGVTCENDGPKTGWSSSGIVVSGSPLTDMSYKAYVFASEEERQAALADPRNAGLKYAREMKGENGCDVEIVYEFKPRPGGGLWVELNYTPQPTSNDQSKNRALKDTTSSYLIPGENTVVVQTSRSAMRRAQHLPVRPGCDDGMLTVIKMSSLFICKATGLPVNISSITMSRTSAEGGPLEHPPAVNISTDPANPTTFLVGPANSTRAQTANPTDPGFRVTMDPADAPVSCGSFYWDPLILSVPGDGKAASGVAAKEVAAKSNDDGGLSIAGAVAVVVLAALGMFRHVRRRQPLRSTDNEAQAAPAQATPVPHGDVCEAISKKL